MTAVQMVFGGWLRRVVSALQPGTPQGRAASDLERQALIDLANRADRGIFVHLPLWLLIAVWSDLLTQQPLFCLINAAVFLANALSRAVLRRHFDSFVAFDYRWARRVYLVLLLANCVHWGILTGLATHFPALQNAEVPLLFASVGVSCSGALSLAISPFVRLWFPACVLGPLVVAMLSQPTPLHTLVALMSVVLVPYLYKSSQVVHDDYWAAAHAHRELEERARQLELLSITDALTQIHNRLYFEHRLVAEWSRAARSALPLSVLIVDLDHFKNINDTHGHPFGDRCLAAAAQALRAGLHRADDVLARYGGEEFAILLPSTDAAAARTVAERLLHNVSSVQLTSEGSVVPLACSIGVSTLVPAARSSPSSVVGEADKALYLAKSQGRIRVVTAMAA